MAKEKIIKEKVTDPNSHRNHEGSFSQLINVLKYGKRTEKNIAIVILIIVLILFIGLGYLCWFRWLPDVWNWGFNPISVKAILSVLAALYLLIIPFFSFVFVNKYVSSINTTRAQIEIEDEQKKIEQKLDEKDEDNLIPLVEYSRIQLKEYYTIGLRQARRSYTFSIIAMWIGFTVIMGGIVLYIFDPLFEGKVNTEYLPVLSVAGGTIVELISALFLWIYQSSLKQMHVFYNRRNFIHNVILCTRIANSMENKDEAKKIIIEKVMDYKWKEFEVTPPKPNK